MIEIPREDPADPRSKRRASLTSVILENYEVQMCLGLHDFEKAEPQRVLISLQVDLNKGEGFWDYDQLVSYINVEIAGSSIETQEELCEKLITFVETSIDPKRIQVQTKKPDIFDQAEFVSIRKDVSYE